MESGTTQLKFPQSESLTETACVRVMGSQTLPLSTETWMPQELMDSSVFQRICTVSPTEKVSPPLGERRLTGAGAKPKISRPAKEAPPPSRDILRPLPSVTVTTALRSSPRNPFAGFMGG